MKRNFVTVCTCLFAIGGILLCGVSFAEDATRSSPRNDPNDISASANESGQALTDEMKAKVAAILSDYDAAALTAADAKAINNAFREAGIHSGPGQKQAIEAAGFDPRKISALDPPPNPNGLPGSKSKSE